MIQQEFHQNFVTSGSNCLFIFLVIRNLIVLYSEHINIISYETSLNILLGFIPKKIKSILIPFLILRFAIDRDALNSFSR